MLCSTLIRDTCFIKFIIITVLPTSAQYTRNWGFYFKNLSSAQDLTFSVNDKASGGSRGLFHRTAASSFFHSGLRAHF